MMRTFVILCAIVIFFGLGAWASPPIKPRAQTPKNLCRIDFGSDDFSGLPKGVQTTLERWIQLTSELSDSKSAQGTQEIGLKKRAQIEFALTKIERSLRSNHLKVAERTFVFHEVMSSIESVHLVSVAPAAVVGFLNRIQFNPKPEVEALTIQALNNVEREGTSAYRDLTDGIRIDPAPSRKNTRIWLQFVIKNHLLGPREWKEALAQAGSASFLSLADGVSGNWSQLNWGPEDVLALARAQLQTGQFSFSEIVRALSLRRTDWIGLQADLSPIQWIEYRYLTHALTERDVSELTARAKAYRPKVVETDYNGRKPLLKLLNDSSVPYSLFEEIYQCLAPHWRSWYGTDLHLVYTEDQAKSPAARARAEKFFGRFAVAPDAVWRDAKKTAKLIGPKLEHGSFASPQDFIDHFKLSRIYRLPPKPWTPEQDVQVHAVAELYFLELRRSLADFLKLNPTFAQIRWLLETPLQFQTDLHDDRRWSHEFDPFLSRIFRRGLKIKGPRDLDTAENIFAILADTLNSAMARVSNINDWIEIATFQIPSAAEYEELQRWALDRFIETAVRVGDPELKWLDAPIFENRQALGFIGLQNRLSWFRQLYELRESVPPQNRSDQSLTQKAIEFILGDELRTKANILITDHLNFPLMKILATLASGPQADTQAQPSSRQIEVALRRLRLALFVYLTARSEANFISEVSYQQFVKLQSIAAEVGGFRLVKVHSTGDFVQFRVQNAR